MTGNQAVVLVVLAAGLFAGLPAFRGMWKGGQALGRVERLWRRVWPYSEAALQGWLRAQMAVYLAACFLVLAYPAAVLHHTADGSTQPVLSAVLWAGFAGLVSMVVVVISIVLFNVPKRLALPSLREQEGLLVGWWRLRGRRAKP
jgi:hypothetical protein